MKRPALVLFLWVLLLALCAWPFTVKAAGTVTGGGVGSWQARSLPGTNWGQPGTTPSQCGQYAQDFLNSILIGPTVGGVSCGKPADNSSSPTAYFTCVKPTAGNWSEQYRCTNNGGGCPANSTSTGAGCACNTNYVPAGDPYGTACQPVSTVCPSFAAGISGEYQFAVSVQSSTFCDSTTFCELKGSMAACIGTDCSVIGPFTSTGKDCTGGVPSVVEPQVCPAGQVSTVVGGNAVCVAPTSTSTSSSSSSTAPAGAGSAPASTVSGGGSTIGVPAGGSSESTTTCVGNQCATTITVKDSAGVVVGSVASSGPKDSFCVENPEASICKASSFSGACSASFACDGDAIQCAIAKEQHSRNCTLFEGQHDTRTVAENALAGVPDAAHPGSEGNVNTVAIDGMIDTAPIIGAGSCPTDVGYAIPILGTMVVPWSDMCSWLQLMGTILVAAAGVTWLFIVFGSKGV